MSSTTHIDGGKGRLLGRIASAGPSLEDSLPPCPPCLPCPWHRSACCQFWNIVLPKRSTQHTQVNKLQWFPFPSQCLLAIRTYALRRPCAGCAAACAAPCSHIHFTPNLHILPTPLEMVAGGRALAVLLPAQHHAQQAQRVHR